MYLEHFIRMRIPNLRVSDRKSEMIKFLPWLYLFLILLLVFAGCGPISSTIQPTQELIIPSQTNLQATDTVAPTSTPTLAVTETPSPTATRTHLATSDPKSMEETIQSLLQDPMNCMVPCFWGIVPGKTSMDEARAFFSHLGFRAFEGTDQNSGRYFYTIAYESGFGRDSYVTLHPNNNRITNIIVNPEITKQKDGIPREWAAFSPETIIQKYGQPSHVDFYLAWPGGGGSEIIMNLYFDKVDLIVQYTGENLFPSSNHSPRLCPLIAPFDYVRLWLGPNPPHPPLAGIALEQATSLTMEQFTQLMLGNQQHACFTLKGDVFQ